MQKESLRKQAKDTLKNLFHSKKAHADETDMAQPGGAGDILQPTSLPKISNLGGVPKELKPGMDAAATQSAGGAPGRFEEVARNTAPPTAKAGGVGHGAPPQQTGVTGMRQGLAPPTPEGAGYSRLTEEGPLAPASTPVGSISSSGNVSGNVHPPASGVAADSVKRAHLGENPLMGARLAKAGVSEEAALAAQDMPHSLHHTRIEHDSSAPYLGAGGTSGSMAAAKPTVTDVGAGSSLKEQTEPLLPSGKKSSPATGHVPDSVLGQGQGQGYGGKSLLDESDKGKLGGAAGGLGTGALLKEHADASKEQDLKSVDASGTKAKGGMEAVPEAGLPPPVGEGLTGTTGTTTGSASAAGTESQAPTTLLGRAQVAVVHAAAATSAAGTTLVNKVSEATGITSTKAKETGNSLQQQAGSAAGSRDTRAGQQVQGATQAPLQRVVEYGQAAAAKASEQAQAAYEAATSKLHETGLPQKAAEHRDAASAKASDLATQAQQQAAQAQQVAAQKAAELQDAARAKAAELYTQAADTSVAAREHAARMGTQLYSQAADQAAVARDQAAQALGEGIDRVRNASEEDINRSRLARGLAMATLLWVVCAVLGIPFKFALTLAFMAVGGMMLKEFAAGRASGGRVGGRGPHGGVKTTEFSSHAPEGRHISPPTAAPGAVSAPDPSAGFAQSAPVNAPAPAPPMLGQQGVPSIGVTPPVSTPPKHSGASAGTGYGSSAGTGTGYSTGTGYGTSAGTGTGYGTSAGTGAGGHETVHTEFGAMKVAKPALDAAHRAAKLVEE